MAGRNPKGALQDQCHYESAEVVACFNAIQPTLLAELQPQQPDIAFHGRDLAILVHQLQQFQQSYLGFGSSDRIPKAPLRIPARLFKISPKTTSLTCTSPLYTILLAAYTHRISQGWTSWDLDNPSRVASNTELIASIRTFLLRMGLLQSPKVYLATSPSIRKALSALASRAQVQLVEDRGKATHILYGDLHVYENGPEEEWFRTLEKRENMVLVHWWYYPDSFDNWLPQTEQFADPEEAPQHDGAWHIMCRWLQDSVRFNEWMNEEDYEELDFEPDEGMSSQQHGRKPSETNSMSSKVSITSDMNPTLDRLVPNTPPPIVPVINTEYQPHVRIRDIESERPQLSHRQRKNEFEPYLNGDITNISRYTDAFIERPREETKSEGKAKASTAPHIDLYAEPYDYSTLMAPDWFDLAAVDERERMSLPEFFLPDESRAEQYKRCRDYMVETYRGHPDYYLTVTACQSALKEVDLVSLARIHNMLEFYGIINTQVDPRRRIYDPIIDSEPEAGVQPKSQRYFKQAMHADTQYLRQWIFDPTLTPSSGSHSWDLTIDDPVNPDARNTFKCKTCTADCSAVRYQSLKYKGFQVCVDCFLEGQFSSVMSSGDFVRMEAPENDSLEDDWSPTELLRLLEAVDRYDDDWLLISEHVSSRSKEQCITQFLQMPINDEFLTAKLSSQELEELPLSDTSNPVMAMVAFLAGHVNPGVGSAAAKSALRVLMQHGEASQGSKDTEMEEAEIDETDAKDASQPPPTKSTFSAEAMNEAMHAVLDSAVEQARKLASYEDQEIQHWTRLATKTLLDKLTVKMGQYNQLDTSVENELKEIEKQRVHIASSIDTLRKQHITLATPPTPASTSTPI